MKKILGIFLRGAFTLAPIALTIYILFKVYEILDGFFRGYLEAAGLYFPGLGALLTIGLVFLIGLLASNWITGNLLKLVEKMFSRIPVVKNIYGIIKDTISSFSGDKKGFSRLVMIELPNNPMKLLGFVTNDDTHRFIPAGYIAVYLMQSMQWAGNLVLVPAEYVKEVNATPEEAIKFIASAGLVKS